MRIKGQSAKQRSEEAKIFARLSQKLKEEIAACARRRKFPPLEVLRRGMGYEEEREFNQKTVETLFEGGFTMRIQRSSPQKVTIRAVRKLPKTFKVVSLQMNEAGTTLNGMCYTREKSEKINLFFLRAPEGKNFWKVLKSHD